REARFGERRKTGLRPRCARALRPLAPARTSRQKARPGARKSPQIDMRSECAEAVPKRSSSAKRGSASNKSACWRAERRQRVSDKEARATRLRFSARRSLHSSREKSRRENLACPFVRSPLVGEQARSAPRGVSGDAAS